MSEKTEKATPWKLQKAKEQGQVSKSIELNTCIFLLVLLGVAAALAPSSVVQIKQLLRHLLYLSAHTPFSVDAMTQLQQIVWLKLTSLWIPFALAGMLSIILATLAQTGFVWSTKPLEPDFKRLDLIKGCKRLFSLKLLFETGKNSLKLVLVCGLLYFSLKHELPYFSGFMKTSPGHLLTLIIPMFSKIILKLLVLLLALAIADKAYTRWRFNQDNRMSKQELKEEYRQREGDPKIKLKIKQLQHQLRQKTASLEQVKTADVVLLDSTQFAVVLKYDRGLMPAPKVVCKAQAEMVKQVTQLAKQHHVPIIENKTLARLLFTASNLNQWVNREHFPMVAAVFRDVYRQKAMP